MPGGGITKIDEDDYAKVARFKLHWMGKKRQYVGCSDTQSLHRKIMGLEKGDRRTIDHINDDPSDNRKCNLRIVDFSSNTQRCKRKRARTGYRGVSAYGSRFRAQVSEFNRTKYLGTFDSAKEAAACYDAYTANKYGPLARTNVTE